MKKMTLLSANWCGPCGVIKECIGRNEYQVEVIDIDKDPAAAREFGIRGIPTLVVFTDEKPELVTGVHNILVKMKEVSNAQTA
ncbi:hypothetical protein [Pseudomonas phage PPAY]|uniref:Thioredoxin-like protein n=1 Tax=Pseudomonas phage TC6 TaxID=2060947 RepID=A0A2H5BQC7_9CAUD|nr:hypothetical protein ORF026 [Pseudomonas phage PA11]AUG88538.1 thioredoxin-like protein [Pseudomonas phage TC6]UCW44292.1 hypothetical protein [Pseudomonas phage PPAY]UCW44471.1 hypothetical protein [Pseudomonas phage PPAT]UVN13509.1 hypothetical protein FBPa8_0045 [Pseudomonas phage vB_PaeP_FBPa8]